MSKIGKLPIEIKDGTTVAVANRVVTVTGSAGSTTFALPQGIDVLVEENKVIVSQEEKGSTQTRALFGLTRAQLANIMKGVSTGFEKKLELAGVGYRASVQGADLVLSLGFSHPVKVKPEKGITFKVAENVIIVSGSDKAVVGNTAAQIRSLRPPEPYKGKGIKYSDEIVKRKCAVVR